MKQIQPTHFRILAIAPATRGFGFALMEGQETLVDWGVKSVTGDKNSQSLAKAEEQMLLYQPEVMVLEDCSSKQCRRSLRIRTLIKEIMATASRHKIKVALCSQKQVKQAILDQIEGTKHEVAEVLAKRFPEELGSRLPPQRRPWESEDSRMHLFDAVALALAFRLRREK